MKTSDNAKTRAALLARLTDAADLARVNLASRATLGRHSLRALEAGFITPAQHAETMRVARSMDVADGWDDLWTNLVHAAQPAPAVDKDEAFARAAVHAQAALTTEHSANAYAHHVNARAAWAQVTA